MKRIWILLLGIVLGVFLVIPAMAAEEQDPGMKGMEMGKSEMPMHHMMCAGHSIMKGMCEMMKDMAGMMQMTEEAKLNADMMEKCKEIQQRCDEMLGQMDQMMEKCKEMMEKGACPMMGKKGHALEREKEEEAEGPITINININNKAMGPHLGREKGMGGCCHP